MEIIDVTTYQPIDWEEEESIRLLHDRDGYHQYITREDLDHTKKLLKSGFFKDLLEY